LFLVPLAYSSSLADPFAFVKRSLMLLVVLLLWGLALLAPAAGDRPRLVAPVRTLAIVFLVSAAAACVVSANRRLAFSGLLGLAPCLRRPARACRFGAHLHRQARGLVGGGLRPAGRRPGPHRPGRRARRPLDRPGPRSGRGGSARSPDSRDRRSGRGLGVPPDL